jgi:hypothetical protein
MVVQIKYIKNISISSYSLSNELKEESRSSKLYSNWQLPAVFAEHRRHMYTFINIKKKEEKKEQESRTNHSYVNANKVKGVMPFIENSNTYIV